VSGYLLQTTTEVFGIPVPWLLGICLDCTVSIAPRDFLIAQRNLISFLLETHKRGLSGCPSDFVSVKAFKERGHVIGPRVPLTVVKMDQPGHVGALCDWINRLQRDGKRTALYDAVMNSAWDLLQLHDQLGADYLKVVLVITDGEDNDSQRRLRELALFDETDLNLAVIGVGNSTKGELDRLVPYAVLTQSIDCFDDLFLAMSTVVRVVFHQYQQLQNAAPEPEVCETCGVCPTNGSPWQLHYCTSRNCHVFGVLYCTRCIRELGSCANILGGVGRCPVCRVGELASRTRR